MIIVPAIRVGKPCELLEISRNLNYVLRHDNGSPVYLLRFPLPPLFSEVQQSQRPLRRSPPYLGSSISVPNPFLSLGSSGDNRVGLSLFV